MAQFRPVTLAERLYWNYTNYAMAEMAVHNQDVAFARQHFMIRVRLFKGLTAVYPRSLMDDTHFRRSRGQRSGKVCERMRTPGVGEIGVARVGYALNSRLHLASGDHCPESLRQLGLRKRPAAGREQMRLHAAPPEPSLLNVASSRPNRFAQSRHTRFLRAAGGG